MDCRNWAEEGIMYTIMMIFLQQLLFEIDICYHVITVTIYMTSHSDHTKKYRYSNRHSIKTASMRFIKDSTSIQELLKASCKERVNWFKPEAAVDWLGMCVRPADWLRSVVEGRQLSPVTLTGNNLSGILVRSQTYCDIYWRDTVCIFS